jgi:hypothetical protein
MTMSRINRFLFLVAFSAAPNFHARRRAGTNGSFRVTCPIGAGNLISIGEDQCRTTYSRVLDESTQAQLGEDWRMRSSGPVVQH